MDDLNSFLKLENFILSLKMFSTRTVLHDAALFTLYSLSFFFFSPPNRENENREAGRKNVSGGIRVLFHNCNSSLPTAHLHFPPRLVCSAEWGPFVPTSGLSSIFPDSQVTAGRPKGSGKKWDSLCLFVWGFFLLSLKESLLNNVCDWWTSAALKKKRNYWATISIRHSLPCPHNCCVLSRVEEGEQGNAVNPPCSSRGSLFGMIWKNKENIFGVLHCNTRVWFVIRVEEGPWVQQNASTATCLSVFLLQTDGWCVMRVVTDNV